MQGKHSSAVQHATRNLMRHRPGATAEFGISLDKLPGGMFQLFRSIDGHWTAPWVGREIPPLFRTSANALALDATAAADWVPAEDRERLKISLTHSRDSGQTLKARFRLQPPDTPERWCEITATPELSFSGGTMWHGFLIDVTRDEQTNRELRSLHRRWTLAARAAGIGVLEFDLGTAILSFDAIACAHHGIEAEQTWLGLSEWLEMVRAEDRLVASTALASPPIDGFAECLVLQVASANTGDARTLEYMFQAVNDERRLVGTCRDITQQLSVEALRRDKLAAEKANHSKGEFMSRVSHELRTPLNGILGFVQLMALDRSNPLPPLNMQRLDVIEQSGNRLLALIDQLLDVARIEEGRWTMRPRAIDLPPLVDQCVAAAYPLSQARGVEVLVEIAPEASALHVDPEAMQQVLSNLLANAIKYNRANGKVRVRFQVRGKTGRLVVDDTGIGMSEAQLAMLFEPFNRLGAEQTAVRGSGLGLVITQKLVHAMGGTLDVRSVVGRGSRFQVLLPLADHDQTADSGDDARRAEPSEWGGDLPQTVLYIEDDEVNTLLMKQVFCGQPALTLRTETTGERGIAAAIETQPSLILLDLHLADTSGFDVLRRLRANPKTGHIRCIAVSADALPSQIEQAMAMGFDGYWTKPLDLPRVMSELKAVLRAEAGG